jgi:hypothetical protein
MDRYPSEMASGRVVHWRAPSWLSDYVLGYSGYQVSTTAPVLRRLVPFGGVSVLLDFTPASRVPAESVPGSSARYQFRLPVAGLFDGPVLFSQAGYHFGVAVGLTPAGAYALLAAVPVVGARHRRRTRRGGRLEQPPFGDPLPGPGRRVSEDGGPHPAFPSRGLYGRRSRPPHVVPGGGGLRVHGPGTPQPGLPAVRRVHPGRAAWTVITGPRAHEGRPAGSRRSSRWPGAERP